MIKNSLGRIGIVFKGNYNSQTEYTPMDVVFYDGSSYICTNPTRDNLPTDNNYWNILVKSVSEEVVNSLQNRIIDLESELPDKEEEGSNINITDSAQARASILPMGNTEQESREGYNLIPVANKNTYTENGITFTSPGDGIIIANGTSTGNAVYRFTNPTGGSDRVNNIEAGTYTAYSPNSNYNTAFLQITIKDNANVEAWENTNPTKTFTTIGGIYAGLIYVRSGVTLNNVIFKPMLVKGEYTETTIPTYEQYGATPSINYPSPIKVVEGSYSNNIENKNLFDKETINIAKNLYIHTTDKKIYQPASIQRDLLYMPCLPNTNYAISKKGVYFRVASSSKVPVLNLDLINVVGADNSTKCTINTGEGAKYLLINYYYPGNDTLTEQEILDSIQVELGNTATDYVEHQEQVKNLDFPEGIQFAKEDELEFSYTEKNGYKTIDRDSVYHVGNIAKEYITKDSAVIMGTTNTADEKRFLLECTLQPISSTDGNIFYDIYSNVTKATTLLQNYQRKEGLAYNGVSRPGIYIYLEETKAMTAEEFKAFCEEYNVYVVYQLATPTRTQITDETFISQLEDLLNSETYKGVTHITTSKGSTEVADLIVKVDYKQSNQVIFSNEIENLKKAILSIGSNV